MAHPVVHWEIGGPDGEGLREFYEKLFGWRTQPVDASYTLVDVGEGPGGGLMRTTAPMSAYVTIYVRVGDLDEALDQVEAIGGARRVPPTKIGGQARFALFADPAGNLVGLLEDKQ